MLYVESYTTARDVLNVTQDRLAPRVQQALESVAANSEGAAAGAEQGRKERGKDGERQGAQGQINPALRGVSQKLLEKVYT